MIRKILVTGATKGIGRKIFEEMLTVGEVYVIARNREILEELKILGAKDVLSCDLSSDLNLAKDFIEKGTGTDSIKASEPRRRGLQPQGLW